MAVYACMSYGCFIFIRLYRYRQTVRGVYKFWNLAWKFLFTFAYQRTVFLLLMILLFFFGILDTSLVVFVVVVNVTFDHFTLAWSYFWGKGRNVTGGGIWCGIDWAWKRGGIKGEGSFRKLSRKELRVRRVL